MSRRERRERHTAIEMQIECDGKDVFVVVDGLKIAKRGHPGTRRMTDVNRRKYNTFEI
jgi:hypothetical protein